MIIRQILFLLFANAFFFVGYAQTRSNSYDTITLHYPAPTYDTLEDGQNRYYNGENRIDKKTSDIYQANGNLISKCRPCILKVYDQFGLSSIGLHYGDKRIGFRYEYYPKTSKIKLMSYYNSDGRENGKWKYFDKKGKLIKQELYANGKLLKKEK